jgi:hypothetical protein
MKNSVDKVKLFTKQATALNNDLLSRIQPAASAASPSEVRIIVQIKAIRHAIHFALIQLKRVPPQESTHSVVAST